jgi:hypothetical protein
MICDKNGKKIIIIPANTVLDNILDDLWNDVIRYLPSPFLISHKICPGYRKMKCGDFSEIKFRNYYIKHGGINTNIKDSTFMNMHICGEECILYFDDERAMVKNNDKNMVEIYNKHDSIVNSESFFSMNKTTAIMISMIIMVPNEAYYNNA